MPLSNITKSVANNSINCSADNPGLGVQTLRDIERAYTLQVLDRLWMDHIDALDVMRASIGFRSMASATP